MCLGKSWQLGNALAAPHLSGALLVAAPLAHLHSILAKCALAIHKSVHTGNDKSQSTASHNLMRDQT